jgi:hypothetical protein
MILMCGSIIKGREACRLEELLSTIWNKGESKEGAYVPGPRLFSAWWLAWSQSMANRLVRSGTDRSHFSSPSSALLRSTLLDHKGACWGIPTISEIHPAHLLIARRNKFHRFTICAKGTKRWRLERLSTCSAPNVRVKQYQPGLSLSTLGDNTVN